MTDLNSHELDKFSRNISSYGDRITGIQLFYISILKVKQMRKELLDQVNIVVQQIISLYNNTKSQLSIQHLIMLGTITFKLLYLITSCVNENRKTLEENHSKTVISITDNTRKVVNAIINNMFGTKNVSLYSHILQQFTRLIRLIPECGKTLFDPFRYLCVQPYFRKFNVNQLQTISLLLEFNLSKVAGILVDVTKNIPNVMMLYPINRQFRISSEQSQQSTTVPKRIVDKYPGIETMKTEQLADVVLDLFMNDKVVLRCRPGIGETINGHMYYNVFKEIANKMKGIETMDEDDEEEDDSMDNADEKTSLMTMRDVEIGTNEEKNDDS